MFSIKLITLMAVSALLLISCGYAQTSAGSSVSLGALAQSGFSGLAGTGSYSAGGVSGIPSMKIGSAAISVPSANANDNVSPNATTMNASSTNDTKVSAVMLGGPAQPQKAVQTPGVINLSNYANDRRSNNLTGYTNIMYPIAESAGFTASAAGGGGCNCGGG